MIDFSEARSFNDGIEFYGKDIIIIATRKDDKVKIEKSFYIVFVISYTY